MLGHPSKGRERRKEEAPVLKFNRFIASPMVGVAVAAFVACIAPSTHAQTIVDEWASVKAPPAPQLKDAKVDAKTTALLVLDLVKGTCNNERRPRCVQSIPKVEKLVSDARAKGLTLVYSLTSTTTPEDILPQVAPKGGEPMVKASVDKFFNTDLDKILKDKGVQTVIIVGTTAEGAVLYTASAAALRGYNVIVPVEGSTAASTWAEAVTAWTLANAPGVSAKTTLTKVDMIAY
jgi:nicotinamidase-related amidase